MSNYASLTGTRPSGYFDSLFVRSPPAIGPFVSVSGLASTVGPSIEALEADLATKRSLADSYSQVEVQDLLDTQAATRYTKAEAVQLLDLKRNTADSLTASETNAPLAAKVDEDTF